MADSTTIDSRGQLDPLLPENSAASASVELGSDEAAARVAVALGHDFARRDLLRQALTHRSFVHERPDLAADDNERLEFLGDSVAGVVAAHLLHARFPEACEGELTRRRANLVNERSFATIASGMAIGHALRLGKGEERTGGRAKPRLLASALEALFAAVLLDAGMLRAIEIAERILGSHIDTLAEGSRDYKSRLQERLQARGLGGPRYKLARTEGPEHARIFHVECVNRDGDTLAAGTGRSKVDAEQDAAREALERLDREEASSESV